MKLSCRHVSICANFSFNYLKKFVRDQRWPTAPLFVVNISPSFGEFTAPLRNRTTERTSHLAGLWISAAISNTQKKQVLPLSKEHGSKLRIKVNGSVAIIRIKKFPIGLHMMYLYFPDTPRIRRKHTYYKGKHRSLVLASMENGLEVNAGKNEYMVMSRDQNAV